ncbi:ABC transporter ATP-binding protein [Pontivivens ytuae]|uniref:ABC transporter ATP-binding protein n=1 Tax=Pontivivens ytuae TaxID=2789856 RepID=A0A7S9LV05_9RHOB|nr:ABC transporter ATP-binding protein [Pontivivens ytuae]QPH55764.1 ABC transporter ATP-binding protein [Pontivivens ytuae]
MSIRLAGVTKRFGARAAVDDVSVELSTGEFFAIVGASGCGKSTLLRLIAGLEVADAGEIALAGRTVSGPGLHVAPEDRNVGFVFQSYALWPHLDVRGNVAFPAEAAGVKRAEAARNADRHLATVALTDYAARKPADLSGGQRQRVALARCLAQEAGTILMDEPLANLDPHLRSTMEEELVGFHRTAGATTVYITHDQREAMAVADRMAVMAEGRFLQVGTPTEIYDRPANAAVARFIGHGAVQPVSVEGGAVRLAGHPVKLRGNGGTHALFRPADLSVTDPDATTLSATVESVLYRGGHWEGTARVEGLSEPFQLHLDRPVEVGERLGLMINGGWILPG